MNEDRALYNLYWFYKMVLAGGPDGSELDTAVCLDAEDAVRWFEADAQKAGGFKPEYDKPKYQKPPLDPLAHLPIFPDNPNK